MHEPVKTTSPASVDMDFSTEIMFPPLRKFDVGDVIGMAGDRWFNRTLAQVNDCVLRVGVAEGQFYWHKHEQEDELFYVLQGTLEIEVQGDERVKLKPGQGFVVPKDTMHRTRAPERSAYLIIEGASVAPAGDS